MAQLSLPPRSAGQSPGALRVGVVIPTYRDRQFLAAAIQSVVDQTYEHWQCVVVDDASPVDVASVVKPFRLADRRVTMLRHAANGGLPAARNTGLRALDVDVVVFLDADDLLVPTALEHAVAAFDPIWTDATVAGVHGQLLPVPEETQLSDIVASTAPYQREMVDWTTYTGDCPFNVHSVVVRKSLLDACGGFDESIRDGAEDWDLWLRLLRHGYRFAPNLRLMGAYRQRRASMTDTHAKQHARRARELFDAAEQWARLDPAITVGRGAAAPLSRSKLALAGGKRVASTVARQIASRDGFDALDVLDDDDLFALLDPAGLVEVRRWELKDAARRGALRGLGVFGSAANALSPSAQRKVSIISTLVADAILDRPVPDVAEHAEFDASARRRPADVLLLAESVADVEALRTIDAGAMAGVEVVAVDLELLNGDSGANAAWRALGMEPIPYHHAVAAIPCVSQVIATAPVGPVVADLLAVAERVGARCDLVRPEGRPATLAVSATAPYERLVGGATVGPVRTTRAAPGILRGWLGSDFPSKLQFEDGPLDVRSVPLLEALRDSRRGETAVVIGNGPSLNDTELEILTDVATFGVNAIFLAVGAAPEADHVLRGRGHVRLRREPFGDQELPGRLEAVPRDVPVVVHGRRASTTTPCSSA